MEINFNQCSYFDQYFTYLTAVLYAERENTVQLMAPEGDV